MSRLDALIEEYDRDHQHPANRALHLVGITLIGTSTLVVWVIPSLGIALFGLGWAAQFLGHAIEGKKPSFTRDRRFMAVGALWYVKTLRGLVSRAQPRTAEPSAAPSKTSQLALMRVLISTASETTNDSAEATSISAWRPSSTATSPSSIDDATFTPSSTLAVAGEARSFGRSVLLASTSAKAGRKIATVAITAPGAPPST